ncbi:hypothetical protein GT204_17785 [Streptomyces sp. SID4919]|uniref:hypothetical protein n=1 Tax=unclassified Streptomyces TaxID=2593676 RepID=UPI000823CE39|nr:MULTISPECIES: hypothetical protein [unclassified Streptomyces]MYY10711.1 hypothetical protein [Streptomyces sp. SID4919]SCK62352.1 hypothetical protein YW7DRAFT_06590 [Streptomyces sp. AmelKG-E11A]
MTAPGHPERAVSDPIGFIADLVAAIEHQLEPDGSVPWSPASRADARSHASSRHTSLSILTC